ncbi:MAG: ergothioneine biosynthesis protein EgtB [Sphingomonadaceae bacterium]|nr:ergothioneine biosynthesis protein EgtB [Sphingomonadaceae bacterium]
MLDDQTGQPETPLDEAPGCSAPGLARFSRVRAQTIALTDGLSEADAQAQSMPDASPAKWHLAHTAWFFEQFVAVPYLRGYRAFDPAFGLLFNSYYEGAGRRVDRAKRGLITRPGLDRVRAYRLYVDQAIGSAWGILSRAANDLVTLGLAHEEQHQELILTDLLHLMSENPLSPALFAGRPPTPCEVPPLRWIEQPGGIAEIGHDPADGFAFDNEGPRHRVLLRRHALASRLVTNAEWEEFVSSGGYGNPLLWLSEGWTWVQAHSVTAPLYWRGEAGAWRQFGLGGEQPLDPAAPVSHISYYEADAYARWFGVRLPTEAEWEVAADGHSAAGGNQMDAPGPVRPRAAESGGLTQLYGDCWEWTASAYLPHPGFRALAGVAGEYNGKFMINQMVLKGGSCFTPRGHVRPSYRNFFPPAARWQVTGLRLARDI